MYKLSLDVGIIYNSLLLRVHVLYCCVYIAHNASGPRSLSLNPLYLRSQTHVAWTYDLTLKRESNSETRRHSKMAVVKYGGYVHDFVREVPDKFVCTICTKVLRDPHLTGCCGQHYCESCLTHWFKKHKAKSCPHCREEKFARLLNKALKREINQLKVYCTFHKEGCTWEGELGDLQAHLSSDKGCSYVELDCPNECMLSSFLETRFRRMDLEKHLKSECSLRKYKCEHCGHEDTYEAITREVVCGFAYSPTCHYDSCPEKPLDCSNMCGTVTIKRKDMTTHREQCPLEPAQCPFQEAGCETRLVRRDLENHIATQTQQHLLLTFQTVCMLRKRCDDLEKKNTDLEVDLKKC